MGHDERSGLTTNNSNNPESIADPWANTPGASLDAVIRCYPRLRGLVHEAVKRHYDGHHGSLTNSPTALTYDVAERLAAQSKPFHDDEHLMALASDFAVQIIIDDQRRRMRAKRGGGDRGVDIPETLADTQQSEPDSENHDAVRSALTRFSASHERAAEVASLRLLFDLKHEQIAGALDISVPTVERDWRFAKAWLADDLRRQGYGFDVDG